MIDMRFVNRPIIEEVFSDVIGYENIKTIRYGKILQWREMRYNSAQDLIWSEWEDVRLEEGEDDG